MNLWPFLIVQPIDSIIIVNVLSLGHWGARHGFTSLFFIIALHTVTTASLFIFSIYLCPSVAVEQSLKYY